jgi:hypothetical protein
MIASAERSMYASPTPLMWADDHWTVVWQSTGVIISELPALGGALNEIEVQPSVGEAPVLADSVWNGAGYGTVWANRKNLRSELAIVADDGAVRSVVPLSGAEGWGRTPTLIWDGEHYIVTYSDNGTPSDMTDEIWAGLYDATGAPITGCMRRLLSNPTWNAAPQIDWDGTDLVIWYLRITASADADIRALRITPQTLE